MYIPTIGLEVHAELKTKSKMFCGCINNPHATNPNTHICPVCTGQPGTLPVPNEKAIQSVLLFGRAIEGVIATYSEFNRKNYFYPDIPKAYQLSQYAYPFVTGGELAGVSLTRVHLEEDTARSQHDKGDYSLVDFNRAGVPLMELVTEPVIHDAQTAGAFARELQITLRTLGISDANMEKGEMRIEANISVSNSEQLGTKVEVKNLNSFRSVEAAITYEVERQVELLQRGEQVEQETRGWDENKQITFTQRKKETAKDYRYFPDPDIPKLQTQEHDQFLQSRLDEIMPELPNNKRKKYEYLGLSTLQIETLLNHEYAWYFYQLEERLNDSEIKTALNFFLTDFIIEDTQGELLNPSEFAILVKLFTSKKITSRVVKDLLWEFKHNSEISVHDIITTRSLLSDLDATELDTILQAVIAEFPKSVQDYKNGKTPALQFLVGQVMKKTKGKALPNEVSHKLSSLLG